MRPTLFDYAGGGPAFLALARSHHQRAWTTPSSTIRSPTPTSTRSTSSVLAAYWAQVLGARRPITDGDGTESGVLRMHAGNGDISDLGRRFVACFDAAMDDVPLPADPEFRRAMHDYMVWAVDRVLAHDDRARSPTGWPSRTGGGPACSTHPAEPHRGPVRRGRHGGSAVAPIAARAPAGPESVATTESDRNLAGW